MSNRTLTLMMGLVAGLILIVGIVFVVIVATGSGGDDDGSPASPGGDQPGDKTPTPRPRTSTGDICTGNSLIRFGSEPLLMDPIQVTDETTAEYLVEIFGGLVYLDLQLKVQPDLAEKWDVSADGKTYTFKLRQNAVFHNGKRVTAQDFKFSFERAADPKNGSPTVLTYLSLIEGLRDRVGNKAQQVSGIRVVDDSTLEIKITSPAEYFLSSLTYPVAYVVDQKQVTDSPRNWTQRPNGTGPFKLAEFKPAERIKLVKNDRFHLGSPKLDEIVFELTGGSISTRYLNNELHVGIVPGTEIEDLKSGKHQLAKDYKPEPRISVSYIGFNVNQPPFDDPKVRQALALSIDKQTINTNLLFDTQRVATGILPPDMPGFSNAIRPLNYDLARARQLLSESKYARNMPRIVMTYGGSGGDPGNLLQAIQAGWKENLGITVELTAVDTAAFLREQRLKKFQVYDTGWAADYPDPEDFIDKLFASDSPQNHLNYKNDRVDQLVQQARGERDRERRFALYRDAEQLIVDDAVVIPVFWPVEHVVVKPCVKNWPSPAMAVPRYRLVEIDPKAR